MDTPNPLLPCKKKKGKKKKKKITGGAVSCFMHSHIPLLRGLETNDKGAPASAFIAWR